MNERILCLDVGDARIGVAVSDAGRIIASPVEVIHRIGWGPDVRRIKELCDQYETTLVLSGLPLNMDGTEGFQAKKVREFCVQVEKAGLTVEFQDERLTTVEAESALLEDNMHRDRRKQTVDKVAAAFILQRYLDGMDNQQEPAGEALTEEDEEETEMDENEIIELLDEEGNEVQFMHLATLEHEGKYYIALVPAEAEDEDDGEDFGVVFMEIAKDEKDEDCYVVVEDDALLDLLLNELNSELEEEDSDE